ncbi:hypothetical protein AB5J55_41045 [Streptomyces sp. R11]|uniref:Uncharacterized protein n=1 Tax=Streptomyces sp. R11 TaxID=3238625 RepID=A0AB39NAG4_9ACTN
MNELPVAPGWKVGGWPAWGLTDPIARFCIAWHRDEPAADHRINEWDRSNVGWAPYEDQAPAALESAGVANPPGVQVSRGNHLQLYVCPKFHSHTDLIQ